jgi:hypothetical protein
MLGISDQSTAGNQSTIFTLPVTGGTPKRITPLSPSYLHGWSPDGKFLVYRAGGTASSTSTRSRRTGAGGDQPDELQGLDDGPEYSPTAHHLLQLHARGTQIWR